MAWAPAGGGQIFATIEECDAALGKPVAPTGQVPDVRFYKHDDLTIKVLFVEAKAAVITYTSLTSLKIPEDKQKKLLNASAAGKTWEEVEGEGAKTWQRSDGQAFAIYDPASGELNIFSTDYIENAREEVQTAINQH